MEASEDRVACPFCAEPVRAAALKCRWCAEWLDAESLDRHPRLQWTARPDGSDRPAYDRSAEDDDSEEITGEMLRSDRVSLEVGPELARLADPDVDGSLLERLKQVRRRIALEFGVIAPGVRVRPHPDIAPGAYQIRIGGDLVAEGEVLLTHMLGIGQDLDVPGVEVEHTTDPIYGTPAVWLPAAQAHLGEQHGLQVFDAQDVVSTHVAEVVKRHLAELLTREEVAELLHMARQDSPMVVQELIPQLLSLGTLRQVLQNLVREGVPIKEMSTILNALADQATYTQDPFQLTEHVRASLGRKICARYQDSGGILHAFMLSPDAERAIQGGIQFSDNQQVLMLDPATSQNLRDNLEQALVDHRGEILDPILVCPPKIRRHVKNLFERNFSKLVVLSYSEIVVGVEVENLATIETSAGCLHPSDPPVVAVEGAVSAHDSWLLEPQAAELDDAPDDGR